ncbi:MAG: lipopolysaccharide biosynthesis protein [Armatimonadota bacterium]
MTTLLRHSAIYLLARGLPGAINFLAIAIYTRLLSPDEYGRYALVVAGVGMVNVVCFQWLNLSVLRFLPAYPTPTALLASVKAMYYLLASVITLVVVVAVFAGVPAAWKGLTLLAVLLLWAQTWFDLNLEITRTRVQPVRYGIGSGIRASTMIIAGTLFLLRYPVAHAPLAGQLLGALAGGFLLSSRQWFGFRARINKAIIQQLVRYGLPLTGTFALSFVIGSSDRFLLAYYLNEQAAGLYAAAYDLTAQILLVVMMVVNLAAYPLAVSSLEQHGVQAARVQLSRNIWLLLAVAVPLAMTLVIFAPQISLVLGSQFHRSASTIIPWIAIAVFLAGIRSYHFDLAFQLGKYTLGQLWVTGIAAATNIMLNMMWIPRWGIQGAAWATLAAYAIALVASTVLGRKVFPVPVNWKGIMQVAAAAFAMLLVCFVIPRPDNLVGSLLQVSTAIFTYFCCTLVLLYMVRHRERIFMGNGIFARRSRRDQ